MPDTALATPSRHWLNRTVLGAGLTSGFGDLCYETANAVLPGFLAILGVPPAAIGAVEGAADGLNSFTKLAIGYLGDRIGRRKVLTVVGYALTPVGEVFIALTGGWPLVLLGRLIGWFGKGMRGPLRDAIVAGAVTPETRGRAFGLHRAADTVGAVLGPLLGVALLAWANELGLPSTEAALRMVLWLAIIPGALSALSFALLVQDAGKPAAKKHSFTGSLALFPPAFRRYLIAVGVFAIGDFSPALLILAVTQLLAPQYGTLGAAQLAASFYVLRNATQAITSLPIGIAADHFGLRRVLVVGYALGATTAFAMTVGFAFGTESWLLLGGIFVLAGLYVAVQEALEPALTAEFLPEAIRGVGYGTLGAVNGTGKLLSSAAVGLVWSYVSPVAAFAAAGALMTLGTATLLWAVTANAGAADQAGA